MMQAVDSNTRPFFPTHPNFPVAITRVILEFLAKSCSPAQFVQTTLVSRAWKQVVTSNEMLHVLFNFYFSSYLHYRDKEDVITWDLLKNWYSNLHGTCSSFDQGIFTLRATPTVEWGMAETDGKNWVIWAGSDKLTLKKTNIVNMSMSAQAIDSFGADTPVESISVLGNRVAVLLKSGIIKVYDVSTEPARLIKSSQLADNIKRIALVKNGCIYRTREGELFYLSDEKQSSVRLTSTHYNAVEQFPWAALAIPLCTSEGGYYLTISNEEDAKTERHLYELRHLAHEGSILTFPFSVDQIWKLDLTDKLLVAFNATTGQLYIYQLATTKEDICKWQMDINDKKQASPLRAKHFVKIWGNHIVLSNSEGRVRILRLDFDKDQEASLVVDRIFNKNDVKMKTIEIEMLRAPFTNPKGLNFVIMPRTVPPPSGAKIKILTWSFSPFNFSPPQPLSSSEPLKIRKRKGRDE